MRKLTIASALAAASVLPTAASAHNAAGRTDGGWALEAWVLVALGASALLYAAGRHRMPCSARDRRWRRRAENIAFAAGIISLLAALEPPLDAVAAELFSLHMVQHLILMLLAAPLFVFARAPLVFFWALSRERRRRLGRWWTRRGFLRAFVCLSSPLSVWAWFCGLFVFWHVPGPYAWALRHEIVHVLEHLCFFVSAFAFWSVVMEPAERRRLDYGATLLFVGTAAILSGLPGALMVLTTRPFYAIHAEGAARWGLTALEDQQLAGLIMWIPAGFAYMAAIIVLLALWLRTAERRAATARRVAALSATSLLVVLGLTGCEPRTGERSPSRYAARSFGGSPQNGAAQIAQVGCGSCHSIPGITGATALVGPPLDHMSRRLYVAGMLRNTPDNMITWLMDPQKIVPGNVMPNMYLNERQARDIAAYLYTLE